MTIERTVADVLEGVGDHSLVADALWDAVLTGELDLGRLRGLLSPLAARNGFSKGGGGAVLSRLQEIAGVDARSVPRRIAAHPTLGPLAAAEVLCAQTAKPLDG